jgi:WD40 repeat protein
VPDSSSHGIFLSYRREDTTPYARLLKSELTGRFPDAPVFMDLDSIEPGVDFIEVIERAVGSCAVLVVLIGQRWVTLADEGGQRRLDDPDDFVRSEVHTALERGVRVIPVLVDGARPVRRQELPDELQKLARLNALELSAGRYQYDADRLFNVIEQVLGAIREREEAERKAAEETEEANRKAREAAERKAREAAERKAREAAERKARKAAERKARKAAERQTRVPSRLIRSLTGHTDEANDVAFSPDGRLLASASVDKTARLWEVATGEERRQLTHPYQVHGVAFSPDGRLIATAELGRALLWKVASGTKDYEFKAPSYVESVAFSPDGSLLAICGGEGTAGLWKVTGRAKTRALIGHTGEVRGVAFSPDGRLVATGGRDDTVRLWEVVSRKRAALMTLTGHTGGVNDVAFSPDGRLLASASDDKTVRL